MTAFLDLIGEIGKPWFAQWKTLLQRLEITTGANEAALSAIGSTSSTAHTLTLTVKTFALFPETRVLPVGATIRAVANANGAASLAGIITAAGPGTVTVDVTEKTGAGGPYDGWTLVIGGPKPADGIDGDPGPQGPAGPSFRHDSYGQFVLSQISRSQSFLP